MGFPIISNIYRAGGISINERERFPVHAAVLFSPSDQEFSDTFRRIFMRLDQLTGNRLAFFAVLDPPREWLVNSHDRLWWGSYLRYVGKYGFSHDDPVMVNEIARMFGVKWHELPVIVFSVNLWRDDPIIVPTSANQVEDQILKMARFSKSQPRGVIFNGIRNTLDENRWGYKVLTRKPDDFNNVKDFYYKLNSPVITVSKAIQEIRRIEDINKTLRGQFADDVEESEEYLSVVEANTRALITPLTQLKRVVEKRFEPTKYDFDDWEDSTSLRVDNYFRETGKDNNIFENLDTSRLAKSLEGSLEKIKPDWYLDLEEESRVFLDTLDRLKLGLVLLEELHLEIADYTPYLTEIWKTFENEVNHSFIQAVRYALGIKMPDYFTKYMPGFPKRDAIVVVDNRSNNLNEEDWFDTSGRHRFFSLGGAKKIFEKKMEDDAIMLLLSLPKIQIPEDFFEKWDRIIKIRNEGSHIKSLCKGKYDELMEIMGEELFKPMECIKNQIISI